MKMRNFVRLQYQYGDYCESSVLYSKDPISLSELVKCIITLPLKVQESYGKDKAGIVALKCIDIMIKFSKNANEYYFGHGNSQSYYVNFKSKKSINRTERVDIEICGLAGKDLFENQLITNLKNFIQKMF